MNARLHKAIEEKAEVETAMRNLILKTNKAQSRRKGSTVALEEELDYHKKLNAAYEAKLATLEVQTENARIFFFSLQSVLCSL